MLNGNENSNEFLEMLEDYLPAEKTGGKNQRVVGTINSIERNFVYLDVPGQRTVVRVRAEELSEYNVGDQVEVVLVGLLEADDDQEVLIASRKRIDLEDNWKHIEDSYENKTVLSGRIVKKIKGGYIVEAALYQGFLPNSLSEINEKDGEAMVGKNIDVIVKDIKQDSRDKRSKKITFSKKDITLMKEGEEFAKLTVGDVVTCTVSGIMDFGLSVMIDHLRGFIHISEVSWKRLDDLRDLYTVGQTVEAKILSLDEEKKNIKLSIKQLTTNPWDLSKDAFHEGDEVEGKVTRVLAYGAFVELTEGVEGLVHISDFAWNKKRINMEEYAKVGETVKVKILEFNPEGRKLKLGFKQLVENPWDVAEEKFAEGKELTATILDIKPFGLFAEIESGVDVFVHSSDFGWPGDEPANYQVGDTISFKVLELNVEDKKIKGSIKALKKSPWDKAMEEYKVGTTVEKKIKNIMDFGLFVELSKGIDGFIPTQFASKDFVKDLKDKFEIGQVVKAQIVEINQETQKIKLSIKKIELEEQKREDQDLLAKYGTAGE
ncbi:30S ribosomal protein S1 [Fusobacterium gonidiaformans]|uniref:30S ribosomal protein S1 n=1 Tax=Fusobacterium gonidiaformans TaxID=849 RepID=UPI00307CCA10